MFWLRRAGAAASTLPALSLSSSQVWCMQANPPSFGVPPPLPHSAHKPAQTRKLFELGFKKLTDVQYQQQQLIQTTQMQQERENKAAEAAVLKEFADKLKLTWPPITLKDRGRPSRIQLWDAALSEAVLTMPSQPNGVDWWDAAVETKLSAGVPPKNWKVEDFGG